MGKYQQISLKARTIPHKKRQELLQTFPEVELHKHIQSLFESIEPNDLVEVTHGTKELGKDLVVVQKGFLGENVIGVVVKKGNVKGQTLGKVDEIKSQVNQALRHPARLKSVKNPLKVTQILVLVAGEFGGNAQERLLKEIEEESNFRNVHIRDIDWLVEQFTEHYPLIFFEEKAVDFLQHKIQYIEDKYRAPNTEKNFSEYFISPLFQYLDVTVDIAKESTGRTILSLAKSLRKHKKPFSSLKHLTEHKRNIILAGDPGTGKSLVLAKIALDKLKKAFSRTTREKSNKPIEIPILVQAKKLVNFSNSEELIEDFIGDKDIIDRYKIEHLLVDALDEVSLDDRSIVLERAQQFSLDLNCPLVISSRKIDIIKSTPQGFEQYELLPFEIGQAMELFRKLAKNATMLEALQDGLERVKSHIIMTPLSLLMLMRIVEEREEVPASITELYDRYTHTVLGRYDRDKDIEVLFAYITKGHFLAELAYHEFYQKDRLEILYDDFDNYAKSFFVNYRGDEKAGFDYFMSEIKRSGLLKCGKTTVRFWHRSFLDYYVAFYIYDTREDFQNLEDVVVSIYYDLAWSETAFFYSGLKRRISLSMLKKILNDERENLDVHINKLMVGRLLQAAWDSSRKTMLFGVEEAIKFVPSTRQKFLTLVRKSKGYIPEIAADMLLIVLSDLSFKSKFLHKEVMSSFRALLQVKPDATVMYKMLTLLWPMQKFLTDDELAEYIRELASRAKKAQLPFREEASIFLILNAFPIADKSTRKLVSGHIKQLKNENNSIFEKIVPKHDGYRPGRNHRF